MRTTSRIFGLVAMTCSMLTTVAGSTGCRNEVGPGPTDPGSPTLEQLATGDSVRIVDLTHPLSPDSLYWPTAFPFEHERVAWGINESGYFYAAAAFRSPEHLGTHLDAPIHFSEGGWTSAEIPVDRFVAHGVVIDLTERAFGDPETTLDPADIEAWEERYGPIPTGAVVIVRTGWSARWPDWNAYYGSTTPDDVSTLHFPGVSDAAARALVDRAVAGVGIDTASIDPGRSQDFQAHRVLAAANIFNLENLTEVDELPPLGFLLIALPMKIADGTGGPTRVVAILDESVRGATAAEVP